MIHIFNGDSKNWKDERRVVVNALSFFFIKLHFASFLALTIALRLCCSG